MRRRVLQAAVTVTAALALAACAVPGDTEADTEEAREEVTEKVVPLPHTERVSLHGVQQVGPFDLPKGATLTVSISARWDRPAACPKTSFWLEPARRRAIIGTYSDTLEPRAIKPDGSTHVERWTKLDGGRYIVDLDDQYRHKECTLVGTITVSSP